MRFNPFLNCNLFHARFKTSQWHKTYILIATIMLYNDWFDAKINTSKHFIHEKTLTLAGKLTHPEGRRRTGDTHSAWTTPFYSVSRKHLQANGLRNTQAQHETNSNVKDGLSDCKRPSFTSRNAVKSLGFDGIKAHKSTLNCNPYVAKLHIKGMMHRHKRQENKHARSWFKILVCHEILPQEHKEVLKIS